MFCYNVLRCFCIFHFRIFDTKKKTKIFFSSPSSWFFCHRCFRHMDFKMFITHQSKIKRFPPSAKGERERKNTEKEWEIVTNQSLMDSLLTSTYIMNIYIYECMYGWWCSFKCNGEFNHQKHFHFSRHEKGKSISVFSFFLFVIVRARTCKTKYLHCVSGWHLSVMYFYLADAAAAVNIILFWSLYYEPTTKSCYHFAILKRLLHVKYINVENIKWFRFCRTEKCALNGNDEKTPTKNILWVIYVPNNNKFIPNEHNALENKRPTERQREIETETEKKLFRILPYAWHYGKCNERIVCENGERNVLNIFFPFFRNWQVKQANGVGLVMLKNCDGIMEFFTKNEEKKNLFLLFSLWKSNCKIFLICT